MTKIELVTKLKEMHAKGKSRGEAAISVILFGFKYDEELENHSVREIVELAGLGKNYHNHVYYGRKLTQYLKER